MRLECYLLIRKKLKKKKWSSNHQIENSIDNWYGDIILENSKWWAIAILLFILCIFSISIFHSSKFLQHFDWILLIHIISHCIHLKVMVLFHLCVSRTFMGTNLNPQWEKFLVPSEGILTYIWNFICWLEFLPFYLICFYWIHAAQNYQQIFCSYSSCILQLPGTSSHFWCHHV